MVKDGYGLTPLHWAAWNGHQALGQMLLDQVTELADLGGSVQLGPHRAASNEYGIVLQQPLLEEAGHMVEDRAVVVIYDVDAKGGSGETGLRWVAGKWSEAVVQLLRKKRADLPAVNKPGMTPQTAQELNLNYPRHKQS
ncbi:MAG: hypothetical protein M1839_006404 [Geoglossum umbratile]|nr:MAG: hypothetical protein M1839_006404 [Geoglossum umbratile]